MIILQAITTAILSGMQLAEQPRHDMFAFGSMIFSWAALCFVLYMKGRRDGRREATNEAREIMMATKGLLENMLEHLKTLKKDT